MNHQKYEQLIHEYQVKISSILKKNNDLSNETNDLMNSININRDIIMEYYKDHPNFSIIKKNLDNSIENYLNKINEKVDLELQLNSLENFQQSLPEEVEILQMTNDLLKIELINSIKQIYKYQKELEKRKKNIPKEVTYILPPTKKNLELLNTIEKIQKDIKDNPSQEMDDREIEILGDEIQIIEEQINKIKPNYIKNNIEQNEVELNDEGDNEDDSGMGKKFETIPENDMNEDLEMENKNYENENLQMMQQIRYYSKQVENIEKENNANRKKMKEYNIEYKNLQQELKNLCDSYKIKQEEYNYK